MPDLPRHLKQLEQELLTLDEGAMLLEVLDGFIAGLLVCPELIMPSEWLRWVWDSEEGGEPRRQCPGCGSSSMPFSTIGNYPKNNIPPYASPRRTTSLDGSSPSTSGASRMTSLPTCHRHSMPHPPARSDAMNHAPAVQVKNMKNAAQSIEPRLSADAYNGS